MLAHIYASVVKATGIDTKVRKSEDPVTELDTGTASIAPGLTGAVLHRFSPQQTVSGDAETTYKAMIASLPAGVAAADYGVAEDRPAIVAPSGAVSGWPKADLVTLARHCDWLARAGSAGQVPPVRKLGGCETGQPRQFGGAGQLLTALRGGEVAVGWITTADPAIPADGVRVLADGKDWLPANSVVPLYRRNELTEPQVLSLNKVAGELTTDDLAAMTRAVATGKEPQQVVDRWLDDHQVLLR